MNHYNQVNDHYCYSGTRVLKNKLGIRDGIVLEIMENKITVQRVDSVAYVSPPYDLASVCHIHKCLFSEIYEWAGEIRDVDISKGGTYFCTSRRITAEMGKLFSILEKDRWLSELSKDMFCEKMAEYYCEFNMIHPFRDGNGRTQRILFWHIALSAGYDIDWDAVDRHEWVRANIAGVSLMYDHMANLFKRIITPLDMSEKC